MSAKPHPEDLLDRFRLVDLRFVASLSQRAPEL
jgi:hypothetical protein